jgi:hypothetical protein
MKSERPNSKAAPFITESRRRVNLGTGSGNGKALLSTGGRSPTKLEKAMPNPQFVGTTELDHQHPLFDKLPTDREPVSRAIRARARTADWEKQIARAFLYVHGRVQTPEEAAELERLYEAALAEGPDFIHCREKSELKDAPAISLDGNGITKLMVTFYTMTRNAWTAKGRGKHRGLMSRCAEEVFKALIYLAGKYQRIFPSIKGLAYLARCCPQSVSDALNQLEALGIVTRHRRLKRVMTPLGFKTVQNTNAYEVHPPKTGLGKLAEAMFGHKKPMETTESNKSGASASLVSFPCAANMPKPESEPRGEPLHVLYTRWRAQTAL